MAHSTLSKSDLRSPGAKPERPGVYREVGPLGGTVKKAVKTTISEGTPQFPPTREKGRRWIWVASTPK